MASKENENVRSQRIIILSKVRFSLCQTMPRLTVSKGAVHGTLKGFEETGSDASKARSDRPKVTTPLGNQYIKLRRWKSSLIT